jgi:hypothetical protein
MWNEFSLKKNKIVCRRFGIYDSRLTTVHPVTVMADHKVMITLTLTHLHFSGSSNNDSSMFPTHEKSGHFDPPMAINLARSLADAAADQLHQLLNYCFKSCSSCLIFRTITKGSSECHISLQKKVNTP